MKAAGKTWNLKSAGLLKIEMAGRNLSVPYAPPGEKRIDDDDEHLSTNQRSISKKLAH